MRYTWGKKRPTLTPRIIHAAREHINKQHITLLSRGSVNSSAWSGHIARHHGSLQSCRYDQNSKSESKCVRLFLHRNSFTFSSSRPLLVHILFVLPVKTIHLVVDGSSKLHVSMYVLNYSYYYYCTSLTQRVAVYHQQQQCVATAVSHPTNFEVEENSIGVHMLQPLRVCMFHTSFTLWYLSTHPPT